MSTTEGKPLKAWATRMKGSADEGLRIAETAAKARYHAMLGARDHYSRPSFADVRVRRVPELDRGAELFRMQGGLRIEFALARLADADAVESWNASHLIATPVAVRMDHGEIRHTRTRSAAWMLGGHTAVVLLDGIRGSYRLDRCTPLRAEEEG